MTVRDIPALNASLNGVAIDRVLAVNESPLRRLEVGEIPSATKSAVVGASVLILATNYILTEVFFTS